MECSPTHSTVTVRYLRSGEESLELPPPPPPPPLPPPERGLSRFTMEDEEEEGGESCDSHVTLSIGSMLHRKLIT